MKTKEQYTELALNAIKKHKLVFMYQVPFYVPFCQATFYNHKLEEVENIKNAIEYNKVEAKRKMLEKWEKDNNPTLNIARYRLLANSMEFDRLVSNKHEVKGNIKTNNSNEHKIIIEDYRDKKKTK